jgi:hypothetical protein
LFVKLVVVLQKRAEEDDDDFGKSHFPGQAGLLGAGAPNTLFKLKRAVFDTEKGQLLFN